MSNRGWRIALLFLPALALSRVAFTAMGQGPTSQSVLPSIQPVAYFQQNCARCHGDYGSNYGDQFAKNLSDGKLGQAVDEMCSGPGNAPLSGVDLQAEIAFHRALADRKPFICVVARDGQTVSGEATPGSQLTVEADGKLSPILVNEAGAWSAKIPIDAKLTAKLKDQSTSIQLGGSEAFSHAAPKS